jgi:DNA-binding CsgD family transcriptional regulator
MSSSESSLQITKPQITKSQITKRLGSVRPPEVPKLGPANFVPPEPEPAGPIVCLDPTDPSDSGLLDHPQCCTEAWAGELLEKLLELTPTKRGSILVITDNPCPEYAADLWDLEPCGLLIHPSLEKITATLELSANGQRYREPDLFQSPLTPCERSLLRHLPVGLPNKRIAKRLALSERTVRNRLVDICEKLGLENRTQIAMYYTGQWQWLERYHDRFEAFCLHRPA